MDELRIDASLVGKRVRHGSRPEWGAGTVLALLPTRVDGKPVMRVSVQFQVGHKHVLVPPARLVPADSTATPQRAAGWLDSLAGETLDARLRRLPEDVTGVLGSVRERLSALAPWFEFTAEPASLAGWARRLSGVRDPLEHWTRDELAAAFEEFCAKRDALLTSLARAAVRVEGAAFLRDWLGEQAAGSQREMRRVLGSVLPGGG